MKEDSEKPHEKLSKIINVLIELFSRAEIENPEMIKDLTEIENILRALQPSEESQMKIWNEVIAILLEVQKTQKEGRGGRAREELLTNFIISRRSSEEEQ